MAPKQVSANDSEPDISRGRLWGSLVTREIMAKRLCRERMSEQGLLDFDPPTTLPTCVPVNQTPHVSDEEYDHWTKKRGKQIKFTEEAWTPELFATWPSYHLVWNFLEAQKISELPPPFVRLSDGNLARTAYCLSRGVITPATAALLWPADFGPGGTVRYGRISVGDPCMITLNGSERMAVIFNSQELCGQDEYLTRLSNQPGYRTTDPYTPGQVAKRLKDLVDEFAAGPRRKAYPRGCRIALSTDHGKLIQTEPKVYDFDRLGTWEKEIPDGLQEEFDKWRKQNPKKKEAAPKKKGSKAVQKKKKDPQTTADTENQDTVIQKGDGGPQDDDAKSGNDDDDDEDEEEEDDEDPEKEDESGEDGELESKASPPSKKIKTSHHTPTRALPTTKSQNPPKSVPTLGQRKVLERKKLKPSDAIPGACQTDIGSMINPPGTSFVGSLLNYNLFNRLQKSDEGQSEAPASPTAHLAPTSHDFFANSDIEAQMVSPITDHTQRNMASQPPTTASVVINQGAQGHQQQENPPLQKRPSGAPERRPAPEDQRAILDQSPYKPLPSLGSYTYTKLKADRMSGGDSENYGPATVTVIADIDPSGELSQQPGRESLPSPSPSSRNQSFTTYLEQALSEMAKGIREYTASSEAGLSDQQAKLDELLLNSRQIGTALGQTNDLLRSISNKQTEHTDMILDFYKLCGRRS